MNIHQQAKVAKANQTVWLGETAAELQIQPRLLKPCGKQVQSFTKL